MNRDFNAKFDRMLENNPSSASPETVSPTETYPESGYARNICFGLPDDSYVFFGYNYLVTCSYQPDANKITIGFTTHTVLLEGNNLADIFYSLMNQTARLICYSDERYNSVTKSKSIVNNIAIVENSS